MKRKALLSWNFGKNSACALHVLRQQEEFDVVGLVTTFNPETKQVAMHGVPVTLVEAQAKATDLPLWPIECHGRVLMTSTSQN